MSPSPLIIRETQTRRKPIDKATISTKNVRADLYLTKQVETMSFQDDAAYYALADCQQALGYEFLTPKLCFTALNVAKPGCQWEYGTEAIYVELNGELSRTGEAVMTQVLAEQLDEDRLSEAANKKQLVKRINVSSPSPKQVTNVLKALIGAVFVDSKENMDKVKQAMRSLGLPQHQDPQAADFTGDP